MRIIDFLLRLYPEEFRSRFGSDVRAFHEERVRERRPPWLRIVTDHITSAAHEQAHALGPDVRMALRSLRRRPTFAAVVILTVALGVGANGAVFSVVNGVLLKSLPYPAADRLVVLSHEPPQWLVSEPQYAVYRDHLAAMQSLAAYSTSEGTLSTSEEPVRIALAQVTRNFFATMGVMPQLGRTFAEGEDIRPARVVILSHSSWVRRFSADRAIIGRSITLNGLPRTVIGVMPAAFAYPNPDVQLWMPICSQRSCESLTTLVPNEADGWANHYLSAVGRLRTGATSGDARRQVADLARSIMREHPQTFDPSAPLTPKLISVQDQIVGTTRPYLIALLGAVAFVLLIVCANVANLLLARGNGRRREIAVRSALGASRRRIVVQLLTESLVLSLIGGAFGIALAWVGQRVLITIAPASIPRLEQVRMDAPVVAYSIVVAFLAGIIFGIIPAVRQGRDATVDALRAGSRGNGSSRGSSRTRNALVVAEIAVAVVLLTGAGMLTRSLVHLQNADIGFRPVGALTANVSLPSSAYDDEKSIRYFDELLPRIRALAGVRVAGAARWLPVVDAGGLWDIVIDGKSYPPGQGPAAVPQEVTPGFFEAMGMRVVEGRDFTEQDRLGETPVAIVNRAFVRRYWAKEPPLGRRFRLGGRDSGWVSVVGVVGDMMARGPGDIPEPSMYFPYAQLTVSGYYVPRSMSLVIRTGGDPTTLASPMRTVVHSIDRSIPISKVRTLDEVVATATSNRRFSTGLILDFALLALILATIGIYGVMSYSVSERTYEIGLRLALGAEQSRVLRLILQVALRLALAGIAIGLLASAALAHWIESLLVGVPTIDWPTMLVVTAMLGVVALLAAFLPAWRAARVDPTEALRAG